MRRTLLATCAGVLLAGATGVAWATPTKGPNIELTIIHATYVDGGASIDSRLPRLPNLTKSEPFTHYNVFTLLDRKQLPLEAGKPVAYGLVNGRNVAVTLGGVTLIAHKTPGHTRGCTTCPRAMPARSATSSRRTSASRARRPT